MAWDIKPIKVNLGDKVKIKKEFHTGDALHHGFGNMVLHKDEVGVVIAKRSYDTIHDVRIDFPSFKSFVARDNEIELVEAAPVSVKLDRDIYFVFVSDDYPEQYVGKKETEEAIKDLLDDYAAEDIKVFKAVEIAPVIQESKVSVIIA